MKKIRTTAAILVSVFALGLVGCGAKEAAPATQAGTKEEPTIVKVGVVGEYNGSASAEGYSVDGMNLNLSEKDQKWLGIKDTFKF